jgi:hypothetical protein
MNVDLSIPVLSNWTYQFNRIASGLVADIELSVPAKMYRRAIYFFAKSSSASYFIEGELYATLAEINVFTIPFRFQLGGTLNQMFPSYASAGTVTGIPNAINHSDVDGNAMIPFYLTAACDKIGFRVLNQTAAQTTPRAFLGVRSTTKF